MLLLKPITRGATKFHSTFRSPNEINRFMDGLIDELDDINDSLSDMVRHTATVTVWRKGKNITDSEGDDLLKHKRARKPKLSLRTDPFVLNKKNAKVLGEGMKQWEKLSEISEGFNNALAAGMRFEQSLREGGDQKGADKFARSLNNNKREIKKKLEQARDQIEDFVESKEGLGGLPAKFEAFIGSYRNDLEEILLDDDGDTHMYESLNVRSFADVEYYDEKYQPGEVARFSVYFDFRGVSDPMNSKIRHNRLTLILQYFVELDSGWGWLTLGADYGIQPPSRVVGDLALDIRDVGQAVAYSLTTLQNMGLPNIADWYGMDGVDDVDLLKESDWTKLTLSEYLPRRTKMNDTGMKLVFKVHEGESMAAAKNQIVMYFADWFSKFSIAVDMLPEP